MDFRLCAILAIVLALIGCASEPVRVQLSIDHPANPRAPEAAFTLPPNPFQADVEISVPQASDHPMIHKHGSADQDEEHH